MSYQRQDDSRLDFLDKQVETFAQLCIRQIDRCMSAVNRVDFTEGFSREQLVEDNVNYLLSLIHPLRDVDFDNALKAIEEKDEEKTETRLQIRKKLAEVITLLYRKGVLHIRYSDETIEDAPSSTESPFPFAEGDPLGTSSDVSSEELP